MTIDDLVIEMKRRAADEGGPMFLGRPDRWWDAGLRRCPKGHVSRTVLKSEAAGRDLCLACHQPVVLTFPEDHDGLELFAGDPPGAFFVMSDVDEDTLICPNCASVLPADTFEAAENDEYATHELCDLCGKPLEGGRE